MMHSLQYPPKTTMEVFKSLPEGTLAEIIEGELYMSPIPTTSHQNVSKKIFLQLQEVVEKSGIGQAWYSPLDVFLDERTNVIQTDLIVLLNDKAGFVKEDGIHCAPDLIIEIVSPGNPKHDTLTKKALYEKFAVKEYWIINPKSGESCGYQLVNGKFEAMPILFSQLRSALLGCEIKF